MTKFGWLIVIFTSVALIAGGCYLVECMSEQFCVLYKFKEIAQ